MRNTGQELDNKKVENATKWSVVTEFSAKLIVPITNMVLARILAPDAFGIIASITMVVSFADMFASAGFRTYLVQHEYLSEDDLYKGASVVFWTNIVFSLVLWVLIFSFKDIIAIAIGNEGKGMALAITAFILPVTSFSSIQQALYQRSFNYKILFYNRLVASILAFVITIPLALLGYGYWSLIAGMVMGEIAKAVILTIKSNWKPNFYYDFSLLINMLSFSLWTLADTFTKWATTWIDILIIGNILGIYYTGLYKNSQSIVTGIIALITAAIMPVLFGALSRTQDSDEEFNKILFKFQKYVSIFTLPMGVGIFVFSDLITAILLGSQWSEASSFIGIWGLCTSLVATYGTFCRDVYWAKGKPRLSLIVQILHLVFVVPICYYGVLRGFNTLIYVRSLAFLQIIIVHFIFMKVFIKISPRKMVMSTIEPLLCSIIMGLLAWFSLQYIEGSLAKFALIIICMLFYFLCLSIFPTYRTLFVDIKHKIITRNKHTQSMCYVNK